MREFVSKLDGIGVSANVALDISVLTEPYFFAVLYALRDVVQLSFVDVFYTEPSSYLPSAFTNERFRPLEVPGYTGEWNYRNEKLLVVVLGFEGAASSFMLQHSEPSLTIPVNGFPSFLLYYKDKSVLRNQSLLGNSFTRTQMRYATANDPFETYNTVAEICDEYQRFAITVSSLGPKPMSLGCALYALNHKEIKVVHAVPEHYPNETTKECGRTWLFRIPLIQDA